MKCLGDIGNMFLVPEVDCPAGEAFTHVIFIWPSVAYFICVSGSSIFLVQFVVSLSVFSIKKSKPFENK